MFLRIMKITVMKKIFGFLSLAMALAAPVFLSGCDDDDNLAENKDGIYEGSVVVWYYEAGDDGKQELKSESFGALVSATIIGDNKLNLKLYRQSAYHRRWVVKGCVSDINIDLKEHPTNQDIEKIVSDNNAHFIGATLIYKFDLQGQKQTDGRIYVKAKFQGLKKPVTFKDGIKDELDPVGEYMGKIKYSKSVAANDNDWSMGNLTEVSRSEYDDVSAVVTYDAEKPGLIINIYHIGIPEIKDGMPQENYDKLVCGGITFNYDGSMECTYTNKEKPNVYKYVYTAKKVR